MNKKKIFFPEVHTNLYRFIKLFLVQSCFTHAQVVPKNKPNTSCSSSIDFFSKNVCCVNFFGQNFSLNAFASSFDYTGDDFFAQNPGNYLG